MTHGLRQWPAYLLGLALVACDPPSKPVQIPAPDPDMFAAEVYPVLLADCGFPACHGDPQRFFRVVGPGRTRLLSTTAPYEPATPDELALSYTRASSMLIDPEGVRVAPLLRKPLAEDAGGSAHAGDDPWGAGVYTTKRDPRYEVLFFWALSAEEANEP